MKVHLLAKEDALDADRSASLHDKELVQDLRLSVVFRAMARGDESLYSVAEEVLLQSVKDVDAILYRQEIVQDCISHSMVVREIYDLMLKGLEQYRTSRFGVFTRTPSAVLYEAVKLLWMFTDILRELRLIVDQHEAEFTSEGITTLFEMIQSQLTDEYLAQVESHLQHLDDSSTLFRAGLGTGNHGTGYTLLNPDTAKSSILNKVFLKRRSRYTFHIHPRDESGGRALAELKNRAVNEVANVMAQSARHILEFFRELKRQLAFYVGCINLHETILSKGEPVCFPVPSPAGEQRYSFHKLYDLSLSLSVNHSVVGNELDDGGTGLVIVTGANQGGKSTFLRSLGITQMMMQSGMFVPAASFSSGIYQRIFTHFRREEDTELKSGKLDEELGRMSSIIDVITPNCLLLCNESFAATNEREGTEIGKQITTALLEAHVKVVFVTHFYQYAHDFYEERRRNVMCLRAERQDNGTRTYKMKAGPPMKTSHGGDLYREIFLRKPKSV